MQDRKSFYITTPIYYVNDVPHIGHSYTSIAADCLARWNRLGGVDTRFLTGTDEHGQKIEQAAQKRGLTPLQLCDEVVLNFQKMGAALNLTYDDFIRTTENRHEKVVQTIFKQLVESGDIYKGSYEGWYCVPCETYVPEAQSGEGHLCPDCKRPLTKMSEESYFFRLSKYQEPLLKYYEEHPDAVMPRSRYNEVTSFIKSGLQDLSVSRTTLKWGIPVPGDERHVVYVWFDALINYLAAAGYPEKGGLWETYWPSVRHLVGKDIIRFHAVIWPAVLLALKVNPPVRVFAHGWWTVEGDKMSKSKGNVVDPFEMVDRYGADAFRYFVMREVPFGNDGDFSELSLVQRINSDLANDIGNLLNRTLQMIDKYRGGIVPAAPVYGESEARMKDLALETAAGMERAMDAFALDEALKILWAFISAGNKYIDETEPWKLGKEGDIERLDAVLRTLWEALRLCALLVAPFMPGSALRMWQQLGLKGDPNQIQRTAWNWGSLDQEITVKKAEVLFPRIDIKEWKAQREAAQNAVPVVTESEIPAMEQITIDAFKKLEIRVAQVEKVEVVPKADKLYKIELNLGHERRTIVSSIREFYTPEQLTGLKILVLCNLKPAKFRGIESHGMLLAAETLVDGKEVLALSTVDRDIPLGSQVN